MYQYKEFKRKKCLKTQGIRGRMCFVFVLVLLNIVEAIRLPDDLPKSDAFPQAVDFGHVYRQGFGDIAFRRPLDQLEMDMITPRNREHMNLPRKPKNNFPIRKEDLVFLSPRDEILYYKKLHEPVEDKGGRDGGLKNTGAKKTSRPIWYDFSDLLEKNLARPYVNRNFRKPDSRTEIDKKVRPTNLQHAENVTTFFHDRSFYLKPQPNRQKINWTTCDEFGRKAVFHPDDIVNTQWLPFFIWSKRNFSAAFIHTFTYPSKKIVQYFKLKYGRYVNNIKWNQPKILMRERREVLLIAADRKGLFYGLPEQELPSTINNMSLALPVLTIRLKIHSPYLAMMYCDEFYASIMAELGTEPYTEKEKILEAETLNIRGSGIPVFRNLETETLLVRMERRRKLEAEGRKIIKIERPLGDVDYSVKH